MRRAAGNIHMLQETPRKAQHHAQRIESLETGRESGNYEEIGASPSSPSRMLRAKTAAEETIMGELPE
ncbi:hypothetical protein FRX31_004371, partial [Thalictrum thalictroides]